MYDAVLTDSRFYQFLVLVDEHLAEEMRRSGCRFCGAALHSARYVRRPRGLPAGVDPGPDFDVCFSFCCSADGCRRRHRAPSVRFLGPKVYVSAMVALITAMRQGPTPRCARQLKALFGVDRRTLAHWREWWERIFPRSRFWQRMRGFFPVQATEDVLPGLLIARCRGSTVLQKVVGMLRFLSQFGSVVDGRSPPAEDAHRGP